MEDIRNKVSIKQDFIGNPNSTTFPFAYPGYDDGRDFEKFQKNLSIHISEQTASTINFDIIAIDPAIANAIRRFIIAEVYILANDQLIAEEALAHRLGLIPINADPRLFQFKQVDDDPTDLNTIVFNLDVTCSENKKNKDHVLLDDKFFHHKGTQKERFPSGIAPVNDDILLTKMRPKQELKLIAHCVKGVGKDHAKFSPVCGTAYRLLPEIRILKPILNEDAEKFKNCFPNGVIAVEKNGQGDMEAKVVNPRLDTVSRECLRHPEFEGKVELNRIRDHFIFNVESTGCLPPDVIVKEALLGLIEKCKVILEAI